MTDKTWQPTLLGHAIRIYAHDALREAGIGDEHHSPYLVDLMRHAINEHGKDRAIEMMQAVWQPVRLGDQGNVPILGLVPEDEAEDAPIGPFHRRPRRRVEPKE